jgi:TatD DNase family protein
VIDTHNHLNVPENFPDPDATLAEARAAGVSGFMVVGIDLEGSRRALALAARHPDVWAIVGHHPNYAQTFEPSFLAEYREMLGHPRAVALGEIGLDYHWDYATREQQMAALLPQLDLAVETGKPAVFHAREAYGDLLDILETRAGHSYLFHCFAGSREDAARAVELDAYFGVDGPITYKKSDELRAVFADLPRDRVVVETDSPYMSPVPHRGKPNQPAYLPLILGALADVWGVEFAEAERVTDANARRFFGV